MPTINTTDKIIMRDDDVLVHSKSYDDTLGRFKQIHESIASADLLVHTPAILCRPIQDFPEAIDYIGNEFVNGRLDIQLHGWEHIDYGKASDAEVIDHLQKSREWIYNTFGATAYKWYTPWGAGTNDPTQRLQKLAVMCNFVMVGTDTCIELIGARGLVNRLREGVSIDTFRNREILFHWWEGGARVMRVAEIAKHGSVEEAKKHNKELFKGW
jgi:hypothetical protein